MNRVLIIGAGGHGSELVSYMHDLENARMPVSLRGLIDDGKMPGPYKGTEILGRIRDIPKLLIEPTEDGTSYITATGDNRSRRMIVERIEALAIEGLSAWSLCHPSVLVGRNVEIGAGSLLAPGSIITTNVRIGRHCIVNVGASISHDSIIGDFSNINPGVVVAGNVTIGQGAYIGAGAVIIDKVAIGEGATVGAGAVVITNIPDMATAVGVPARVIKRND